MSRIALKQIACNVAVFFFFVLNRLLSCKKRKYSSSIIFNAYRSSISYITSIIDWKKKTIIFIHFGAIFLFILMQFINDDRIAMYPSLQCIMITRDGSTLRKCAAFALFELPEIYAISGNLPNIYFQNALKFPLNFFFSFLSTDFILYEFVLKFLWNIFISV